MVVVEDLDDPPGLGSFWGEVNGNLHRALGCVGVVTNGGVRDLEEVQALRFHFFAQHISVSHAYVHIVEAGTPVRVGGSSVRPGDLLHGDRHGLPPSRWIWPPRFRKAWKLWPAWNVSSLPMRNLPVSRSRG